VEEQFYLVAPLIIWLLSQRRLSIFLVVVIAGAPLLRLGLLQCFHADPWLVSVSCRLALTRSRSGCWLLSFGAMQLSSWPHNPHEFCIFFWLILRRRRGLLEVVASVFGVWNGVRWVFVHGAFLWRDVAPGPRQTNEPICGGRANRLAPRTRKGLLLGLLIHLVVDVFCMRFCFTTHLDSRTVELSS